MAPTWLTVVAAVYLDIVIGRRQPMGVMNAVYPVTALYFGPLALAFYRRWARAGTGPMPRERRGIVFQYFAIAPMRGLGLADGLKAAAKADFVSLTCFEIGLFGWMAIMTFVLFPAPNELMPGSAAFWLLMQAGMIIGFATSWPANVWLVRRGIKIPM